MFLSRLIAFFWKPRRGRRVKKSAWPEIELYQKEKKLFAEDQNKYNKLMQSLLESPNPRCNQLAMKYHSEALEIIYIGMTRIYDYEEMVEQRHALNQILNRIREEASRIN